MDEHHDGPAHCDSRKDPGKVGTGSSVANGVSGELAWCEPTFFVLSNHISLTNWTSSVENVVLFLNSICVSTELANQIDKSFQDHTYWQRRNLPDSEKGREAERRRGRGREAGTEAPG